MGFEVAAELYGRFMGAYSKPLATGFIELTGARPGMRALDVGCGPGALTGPLVERLGVGRVSAIDPSSAFVATVRQRWPELDVRQGHAEELPYADGAFDVAVAQLVVHFMKDPVAGLREMGRVAAGGTVAACVWDHAGGQGPLSVFWQAVNELDPGARDESGLAGARQGHLAELASAAGLRDLIEGSLSVVRPYASFDEWWEPYTLGVGPAGEYVRSLDAAACDELRARCRQLLPEGPFEIAASAWTIVARA